jgi:hypothetical protein
MLPKGGWCDLRGGICPWHRLLPVRAQLKYHRSFVLGGQSHRYMVTFVPEHLVCFCDTFVFRFALGPLGSSELRLQQDLAGLSP